MKFEDFKKLKQQQVKQSYHQINHNQRSLHHNHQQQNNNVQVVKSPGSKGGGESQQTANGSDLPVMNAGNGSKSKFTLLGISF